MSDPKTRQPPEDMTGQWASFPESKGTPKFMRRQAETLEKLKAVLEDLVKNKQTEVAQLKEQITRLQRGGGK